MTQSQTQEEREELQEVERAFKRFILEETAGFVSEPMADLYRVNALAQMLDRYDQLRANGAAPTACVQHVKREFKNMDELMRAEGFEEFEEARRSVSRCPSMTEAEVERYIRESDAYLHKQALGTGLCASCCLPLMLMGGLSELAGAAGDTASLLGLVGMFGMIGMGVYSIVTAKKPKDAAKVKRGRFDLSARLRRRLEELMENVDDRARRRMGKGVAMLVTCVLPIFVGAAFDSLFGYADAGAIVGVSGMFAMIGAGVYELVMADGEKKTVKKLLGKKK